MAFGSVQAVNEGCESLYVFNRWRCLKLGVEVDACKHGVAEGLHLGGVAWAYAAREDEGGGALIEVEHVPVKLLSAASVAVTSGFEEEEVGQPFEWGCLQDVVGGRDLYRLDDACALGQCGTELPTVVACLVAVELDDVEGVEGLVVDDFFCGGIDEDARSLAAVGHDGRSVADEAWGRWIENEAHPVDWGEAVYGLYVVSVSHAAHLYDEVAFVCHLRFVF